MLGASLLSVFEMIDGFLGSSKSNQQDFFACLYSLIMNSCNALNTPQLYPYYDSDCFIRRAIFFLHQTHF